MSSYSNVLKNQAEEALNNPQFDFIATYHAVSDLRRLAKKDPRVLDKQTVSSLKKLLQSDTFLRARQAYFLYREAAKALTDIVLLPDDDGMGSMALASLQDLLAGTIGSAHRGIAEAIGNLPVDISAPQVTRATSLQPSRTTWKKLLETNGLSTTGSPWFIGRSLVARTASRDRLLVLKLATKTDEAADLAKEIRWMETLRQKDLSVACRFHIPRPLLHTGNRVFHVNQLPIRIPETLDRHPEGWAIAFVAQQDYFVYPNGHRTDSETALEILGRNAFLLGRLAAKGIIHDAPIPLFHNRTQRLRRDDRGRYQWFRAGRLDQWLDSCEFPNLGLSGLRDFEHFEAIGGHGRSLYRNIGSHIFSLMLVAGSHFRCRDRTRIGLDQKRQPVDARDLFDKQLLQKMIQAIFDGYYRGFTETEATPPLPLNLDRLTDRMIEEMGIDRYMTELFRRSDQSALTDREFALFLQTKGYTEEGIRKQNRGEKDLLITSGPHLGDFNRQISLPELTECTAAMSAVCIAGRHVANRTGQTP